MSGFSTADYVIFCGSLLFSLLIGKTRKLFPLSASVCLYVCLAVWLSESNIPVQNNLSLESVGVYHAYKNREGTANDYFLAGTCFYFYRQNRDLE